MGKDTSVARVALAMMVELHTSLASTMPAAQGRLAVQNRLAVWNRLVARAMPVAPAVLVVLTKPAESAEPVVPTASDISVLVLVLVLVAASVAPDMSARTVSEHSCIAVAAAPVVTGMSSALASVTRAAADMPAARAASVLVGTANTVAWVVPLAVLAAVLTAAPAASTAMPAPAPYIAPIAAPRAPATDAALLAPVAPAEYSPVVQLAAS